MNTSIKQISLTKRLFFYLISYIILSFSLFLFTETILRLLDYNAWIPQKTSDIIQPGGTIYSVDSLLGYKLKSGNYQINFPETKYTWTATHSPKGQRITHPQSLSNNYENRKEIWILGCSITYGWSINDNETYPWLLQQKLPNYKIDNFGVNGYGTVQSFIQLRQAVNSGTIPEYVILAYSPIHEARNVLTRSWTKALSSLGGFEDISLPFAQFDTNGNNYYGMEKKIYKPFPFQKYSAVIYSFEKIYNYIDVGLYQKYEVTRAVIKDIFNFCNDRGIVLIVANIYSDDNSIKTSEFCKTNHIPYVDISVDASIEGNQNLPYDVHPSPKANIHYAETLLTFLQNEIF